MILTPAAMLSIAAIWSVSVAGLHMQLDNIRDDQWYNSFLRTEVAHTHSMGEEVVVAVIDSGVDKSHPDLRSNVIAGVDIVPGGTGNGQQDDDGHGTGMASLIAGHGHGRSAGILGIAPAAKIQPVRIETRAHLGDTDDGARAIEWAVRHGARVICIARTGGVTAELVRAVEQARHSDTVLVAAAGNSPDHSGVGAPANLPNVVAAAAVDRGGNHHPVSVTGPEIVLSAPGVDIVSASRNGGYRDGTGTSDAAAIIAGAAALVRAKYPDLSAEQVIRRLTETADDRGPVGRDEQYGYGVLNLVRALTAPLDRGPTPGRATSTADRPGSERRSTAGPVGLVPILLLAAAAAGTAAVFSGRGRRRRQR